MIDLRQSYQTIILLLDSNDFFVHRKYTFPLLPAQSSGLTGFIAGLSRQPALASRNVTINNLLPGAFDTDRLRVTMQGTAQKTGQSLDQVAEARRMLAPARRFGTAEEFGALCAFVCSAQAGFLTGQNLLIDGGAYPGTY